MAVGTADGTDLWLALVPKPNVETRDTSSGWKVLGQGNLDHTCTGKDIGHTRVGLHCTEVDHRKSPQENFEAIIGDLDRQITNIDQPSTRVDRSDAELSTTETDTTREGSITLGEFLVCHPNNAIGHELDSTDIKSVQGLSQLRQNLRRTSGAINLRREVHHQRAQALQNSSHNRHKKGPKWKTPKLSPDTQGTKPAGRPSKRDKKGVPQTSELGVPWGLFPGKVLSTVHKKTC